MRKLYGEFVGPGTLCFDIGANVGTFSEAFIDLGATVVAVEPVKENFHVLSTRLTARGNGIPLQVAVSSTCGVAKIHVGDILELSSLDKNFLEFSKQFLTTQPKEQTVNLVTLDELIRLYGLPKFCKIDVEGHEKEVLSGLSDVIPVISFEFLFPFKDRALECLKIIQNLSHNTLYNYSLYEFFELENPKWLDAPSFIDCINRLPKSHWTGDIFCKLY